MVYARGFSLVELLVVITIIAILTAIAVPVYNTYTLRAKISTGYSVISGYLEVLKPTIAEQNDQQFLSLYNEFDVVSNQGLPISSDYIYDVGVGANGPVYSTINGDYGNNNCNAVFVAGYMTDLTSGPNATLQGNYPVAWIELQSIEINGQLNDFCVGWASITGARSDLNLIPANCFDMGSSASGVAYQNYLNNLQASTTSCTVQPTITDW